MNMMKHRGYIARVEYDSEDRIFVGHLAGINDIVGFHGSSVDGLEAAFKEAVNEYIAISEKTGRPVQRPYSGNLMLRVTPEVHAAAATAAEAKGKSLNQWASEVLGNASQI
ncbi:type II toxin-antitoxin system HicB family antitoxin [Endozoicomonas gorgoniicola]|uniref:Type II toxin-antitoxin system HicB family antitoxin n=1 Tax=Endozoicomonas gorgoniicola TaxID=1234144 RepID=A0ABT3N219_9GAMM|nr:type II toxin-antitoxin system HicB family antitoxin [Endozoicomonas gorgoniicola]MCW7555682.1 type II toxin-antitoxin system HicB family antitoxin [Endozoicomonas gorgoniicola]